MNFVLVAFGDALGTVARYATSLIPARTDLPLLTLGTNLVGALAIGFAVGIAGKRACSARTALFFKTGVCGGFTTFSTFSLEALTLFGQRAYVPCGLYIAMSVAGCIAGVWYGKKPALLA